MTEKEIGGIRLDVGEVLRHKMPRHYRYVPRFVVKGLARLICQDKLNEIARLHGSKRGVEFADGVLDYLGVRVRIEGEENLPKADDGRFVFVCNHPMGGLDGIAIISHIGRRYGGKIRFLVNDLLMAVSPLADVFLPINKFGRQSRAAAQSIDAAYRSEVQMLTFPAGLCSRLMDNGEITDLAWQKSFVVKAAEHGRNVVPMFFEGVNSKFFYRVARWRKRLKIGFNIEMMLLPREMMKCRNKEFVLRVGKPIACDLLDAANPMASVNKIRSACYELKNMRRD
ncbi:MAG: 1-acyl-sn-glycerol-3-phosphate acyltransferase [Muribaculaceae bacterium]